MRRAYLYFALTFILGAVAGGAGLFFYGWYGGQWRRHPHGHPSKEVIVRRLTHDLNLSDAQVRKLGPIIEDSMKKYSTLQSQIEPQFKAIREESRNQIRQILTPEQTAKFDELVRRMDERIKRQRSDP
jgi:hypothetical protein